MCDSFYEELSTVSRINFFSGYEAFIGTTKNLTRKIVLIRCTKGEVSIARGCTPVIDSSQLLETMSQILVFLIP
jgi:hypothetical protein